MEERFGYILIMASDLYMEDFFIDYCDTFYISSYSNRTHTLLMLNIAMQSENVSITTSKFERILVTIRSVDDKIQSFEISSPIDREKTFHVISRIANLITQENSNLSFSCPDDIDL